MDEEKSKIDSKSGFERSIVTPDKDNNIKQGDEEGGNTDQQGARKQLLSPPIKDQRKNTSTKVSNKVGGASETATANEKKVQHRSKPIAATEEDFYGGISPDLRLVLLGRAGSVKSSVGNSILKNRDTESSTPTQGYKIRQGFVGNKSLTVLETPDELFSEFPQEEIRHCVRLSAPGPHAFLIVTPVKEWTGEERGMLEEMEEKFGEKCWRNTIILLTVTDEEQKKRVEEFIRSGNQEVQRLVEKCGNRFHCLNVQENRDDAQVPDLLQKIEKMLKDNPERFYSREIYQQIREMERRVMDIVLSKNRDEYLKCVVETKENSVKRIFGKTLQDELSKRDKKLKTKIDEMEKRCKQDRKKIVDIYDGEGWIEDQKELMKIILPEVHAMLWDSQTQFRKQEEPREHVKQPEPQTPNRTEPSESEMSDSHTTKL
ncbi:GTPase IMAP family member 4-like [Astyanax mexicanus]|uniref:GTPase IMAP family member 4-like n=1 Tax=Astyanax mexicanus TaxID=7994 RepID=A0A8T2MD27_ASTMX|nr:GTPase IMAP family member 4-like [Astyanax mexicanus]